MTSQWARRRLKSPASRVFTQPLIRAQIKENIKAPRHWSFCGEFTGTGEIPAQKWPVTWKMFPFDDVIMNNQELCIRLLFVVSNQPVVSMPFKITLRVMGNHMVIAMLMKFSREYWYMGRIDTERIVDITQQRKQILLYESYCINFIIQHTHKESYNVL